MSTVTKNEKLELEFIDLTFKGMGVAKVDGFPVFVEGVLPGEKAVVKIDRVTSRYAFGELVELKSRSSERVEVKAKHQALTSIAPLQHIAYEKQLEFKTKLVKDALSKEGIKDVEVRETMASPLDWHYRNKTVIPVRSIDKKMVTGILDRKTRHLVAVDNFKMNNEDIDEIVNKVKDILVEFNEKPYDQRTHTGNIRHIIVRKGFYTDEVMITIVTRSKSLFPISKIVPAIIDAIPNTVSIIHNVNGAKTAQVMGDLSEVIYGESHIVERILDESFLVPSTSFLRANTLQSEAMINTIFGLLNLEGNESVVDVNSSVGILSILMADKVKRIVGVDVVDDNVEIAEVNAENNGVSNVKFIQGHPGNVNELIEFTPQVVIVDSPRETVENIAALNSNKIVYIGGDIAKMTQDLTCFIEAGYKLEVVQPVDMAPQTTQVETICLLSK